MVKNAMSLNISEQPAYCSLDMHANCGRPAARRVVVATLVLVVFAMAGCTADGPKTSLGEKLPHFSGVDVDGQMFDSDELEGQIVLLHFLDAGLEGDSNLGLNAIKTVVANVSDVPGVAVITIYRSFEQSHTPQEDWEANGRAYNVSWRVLPDPEQRIGLKLGMDAGATFGVIVDREGIMQVRTRTSTTCLQDGIHDIHLDPNYPGLFC